MNKKEALSQALAIFVYSFKHANAEDQMILTDKFYNLLLALFID